MNTRGLTELIVLNLALDVGAISNTLFAMLVIMAVVTTLMAGPLLKLIDPKNQYGTAVEDEFADAALAAVQAHPGAAGPGPLDPGRSARPTPPSGSWSRWPSRWRAPSRRAS